MSYAFFAPDVVHNVEVGQVVDKPKDLAYYYSDWIWPQESTDRMKSLLLFFDGLALALPADVAAEVVDRDPVLAQPLMDRGLLTNFEPGAWLDRESAERLAETLTNLLHNRHDDWTHGQRNRIVAAHWGAELAPKAAAAFSKELARLELISGPLGDDGLVWMDPEPRLLVLSVFVRALESSIRQSSSVRLQPTTDNLELGQQYWHASDAYLDCLGRGNFESRDGRRVRHHHDVRWASWILASDLDAAAVDLSSVPLDDVLAFRAEQGQYYKAYANSLRKFLEDSQSLADPEREAELAVRKEEITDMLTDLRRRSLREFRKDCVVMTLSLAGAAWSAIGGDVIGGALAAGGAFAAAKRHEDPVTSYTYLFHAARSLRY